jgi:copper ion binding protein
MTTDVFIVPDMSCQHCINAITSEVTALAGVTHVACTLDNKQVQVEHSPDVSAAAIIAAIQEAGYDEVMVQE